MAAPDFRPGHVLEAKTGGYLVKSRSNAGAWWLVAGDSCSCPARGRCWHMRQVDELAREENARFRRPSMPAHISALVD